MRSKRTILTTIGFALLIAACGDDASGTPDAAPPPNVGSSCNADGGCDPGLACDTTVADGYCTKTCTMAGETSECPAGAICDTVAGAVVECVQICETDEDCRPPLDCNGVSGSNIKACKPNDPAVADAGVTDTGGPHATP